MSLIIPANSASAAGGFDVANSCRFNRGDSPYLSKTFSTDGTHHDKGTISMWVKKSCTGVETGLYHAGTSSRDFLRFESNDTLTFRNTSGHHLNTNRVFRDVSAFYNIVLAFDSSQGTASNRVKIYVNGVQETSFATETYPSQNRDMKMMAAELQRISSDSEGGAAPFMDGYLCEIVGIDGQQLDATSFGEFDEDSGIWKPIDVSGLTFGTNGFYLNMASSTELGTDVSGNSNTFAETNLTAIDQSTDTCTNNFATFNPLSTVFTENISSMLSEGNTQYDPTGNYSIVKATIPFPQSGKFYIESKLGSGNLGGQFGIQRLPATSSSTNSYLGYNTNEATYVYTYDGKFQRSTGGSGDTRTDLTTGLTSWGAGNTLAILFNADDNEIKFYLQDSLKYTLDLSSAPHGYYANDGEWVFAISAYGNDQIHNVNFGNPSVSISSGNTDGNGYGNFEYAVPSGYYALNTKNLSEFG